MKIIHTNASTEQPSYHDVSGMVSSKSDLVHRKNGFASEARPQQWLGNEPLSRHCTDECPHVQIMQNWPMAFQQKEASHLWRTKWASSPLANRNRLPLETCFVQQKWDSWKAGWCGNYATWRYTAHKCLFRRSLFFTRNRYVECGWILRVWFLYEVVWVAPICIHIYF